jgi:hypothetical protein
MLATLLKLYCVCTFITDFFSFVLVYAVPIFACKLFNAPLDFTLCMSRCAKKGSMMKEEEVGIFFPINVDHKT